MYIYIYIHIYIHILISAGAWEKTYIDFSFALFRVVVCFVCLDYLLVCFFLFCFVCFMFGSCCVGC